MKTEDEQIQEHMPFAQRLAEQRYLRKGREGGACLDDWLSDALMGLLRAIRTYDASKGAQFTTFARICILSVMRDGERERDRLRRTMRDRIKDGSQSPVDIRSLDTESPSGTRYSETLFVDAPALPCELFTQPLVSQGWISIREATLLELRYCDDLKPREIADVFGLSEWNVWHAINEVKKTLRQQGETAVRQLLT